jgi:hypothetical protein
MTPDLSICIINHRTPELTRECLRSIADTASGLTLEVFVVNNTGDPLTLEPLRFGRTQVGIVLIQNEQPLGFAANQNQMLARAQGRYWLPLNSDTIVQPGALQELVRFMDANPRCGIAGPKLVHADGSLQPSARNFPTPLTHFLEASGLWQLLRRSRWVGQHYLLCNPHDQVMPADWLTGACLIVRAEAARQVGCYDARLFPGMYGEDMEWCWRMRQCGWEVTFDPDAVVTHLESQSPMGDRAVEMYAGFYRFCAQAYSPLKRHAIRAATVLALFPRWLLARDANGRSTYRRLMALPMPQPM